MSKVSRNAIILILISVLVIGLTAYLYISEKNEEERFYQREVQPLLEACIRTGEAFGVTDFEYFRYVERTQHSDPTLYLKSELFSGLTQDQMHEFFYKLFDDNFDIDIRNKISYGFNDNGAGGLRIVSGDNTYKYYIDYDYYHNKGGVLCINDEYFPLNVPEKKPSSSSKKKCTWCNGTGSVKYYYGDSDLEAAMNGHESSWYGQCGSCGGTGYSD